MLTRRFHRLLNSCSLSNINCNPSCDVEKRTASSANRRRNTFILLIYVVCWLSSAKLNAKSFMKKMKSIVDKGPPCLTPLCEAKKLENLFLYLTHICTELYIAFRAFTIVVLQPSRSSLYTITFCLHYRMPFGSQQTCRKAFHYF